MAISVGDFMVAESEEVQLAIAKDMAENTGVINTILADLGPYVTGEASMVDCQKGLKLLLLVLETTDPEKLSRHDLSALVEYLANRISQSADVHIYRAGLMEVAKSLTALSKMTRKFIKSNATTIAEAIYTLPDKVLLRDFPNPTRESLLELLKCLLTLYLPELKRSMGDRFVKGIVAMAEHEKNPKCIIVVFEIFNKLGREWDPTPAECEEMFDSFIRYFPVTMTSKTHSSAAEIRLQLRRCFESNDFYADFSFKSLLHHLDTDVSADVKNDVFETIMCCVSSYSAPVVSRFSIMIWDSLKWEIWNGENEDFIERAAITIGKIPASLSKQPFDMNDPTNLPADFIGRVAKECNETFHDDSKKRFILGSARILKRIAVTSAYAATLVLRICLPGLFTLWQTLTTSEEKTRFIKVMNLIMEARNDSGREAKHEIKRIAFARIESNQELPPAGTDLKIRSLFTLDETFNAFRKGLVELYFGIMSDASSTDLTLQESVVKGLTTLAGMRNYSTDQLVLESSEKETLISKLNDIALNFGQNKELRDLAVDSLASLSIEDPDTFITITLPRFASKLPESLDIESGKNAALSRIVWILDSLVDIACKKPCKVELLEPKPDALTTYKFRLFEAMQMELIQHLAYKVTTHSEQQSYQMSILAAIYRGLTTFETAVLTEFGTETADTWLVPNAKVDPCTWMVMSLFRRCVDLHKHEDGALYGCWYVGIRDVVKGEVLDDAFVYLVGKFATYVLRSRFTTNRNNFLLKANRESPEEANRVWTLFNSGAHNRKSLDTSQRHLRSGPSHKCSTIILSTALVAGIRPDDGEELRLEAHETAREMIRNAIDTNLKCSKEARTSMLQMMQLLVNKFGADRVKFKDETYLHDFIIQLVKTAPSRSVYQALAYFAAAALAAYEPCSAELIKLMIEKISDPQYGQIVAQSFSILLAPSDTMNEANFCTMRPLRYGRLYSLVTDYILAAIWRSTEDMGLKANCLVALIGVLRYMPTKIIQGNAAQILPVALTGLGTADKATKEACMNIIIVLMPENPSLIEEHLDSIIQRMTDRTHNTLESPSDATVQVRVKALEVLAALPKLLRPELTLKRRNIVMNELDVALDDCSREVRIRADKCKMVWFNIHEDA